MLPMECGRVPRGAPTASAARVARVRALVRSRCYVLDAEATARALIEAVLRASSDQSGGMPRVGNHVASPGTGWAGRLNRFTM